MEQSLHRSQNLLEMKYLSIEEARDLTDHPFLKKYEDDLVQTMKEDWTANDSLNYWSKSYQRSFKMSTFRYEAIYFAEAVEYLMSEAVHGNPSHFSNVALDAFEEYRLQERDLKKYFKWLVIQYVNNSGWNRLEDLPNVIEMTGLHWVAVKKGIPQANPDIGRYKTARDLERLIQDLKREGVFKSTENKDSSRAKLLDKKEAEVHYEDSKIIVYKVNTARACKEFGNDSWCTTRGAFQSYASAGPLYTVHVKANEDEMYHLSFAKMEFTDEDNQSIQERHIIERLNLDRAFPNSIFGIGSQAEKAQLKVLREPHADVYQLLWLSKPSEKVQIACVLVDPYSIEAIKNPSEKVQLAAIEKEPNAYWRIDSPTDKIELRAFDLGARR